jgi:N-succinyldiaminopimelate aminotransferase
MSNRTAKNTAPNSTPSRRCCKEVLQVELPDAGFYLWADVSQTGLSDTEFAQRLYAEYNVTVLPGSYLAREAHGVNPGRNRIRMALVAETDRRPRSCAAHRPILQVPEICKTLN